MGAQTAGGGDRAFVAGRIEVRLDACRELAIPVLRRASGGAAVVTGPGCLMYALVLSYELRPALRVLSNAHRWVLGTLVRALSACVGRRAMPGNERLGDWGLEVFGQ